MNKYLKIALIAFSIIFLICIIGGIGLLRYALNAQPSSEEELQEVTFSRHPRVKQWVDSLQTHNALHDTFIISDDGAKLHAYYVRATSPTKKTAVVVHGYCNGAWGMFHIAAMYNIDFGYNVLIPELRYHGQSEGTHIQMGWNDRFDILRWINTANYIFGDSAQIVTHGISMGAATVMMTSGQDMPQCVKCVVEDCGYTSVWDEFSYQLSDMFHLPEFPLLYAASDICDLFYGWNFKEASSIEQVKKCKVPMLFIHGDDDTYVPTWMVDTLYAAKNGAKEILHVEGAIHAKAYETNPKLYTSTVDNFTKKYIIQ